MCFGGVISGYRPADYFLRAEFGAKRLTVLTCFSFFFFFFYDVGQSLEVHKCATKDALGLAGDTCILARPHWGGRASPARSTFGHFGSCVAIHWYMYMPMYPGPCMNGQVRKWTRGYSDVLILDTAKGYKSIFLVYISFFCGGRKGKKYHVK